MGFDGFCIQTAQKSHHMWPHPALLSNGVGGTMLLMGRCWCNAGDSDDISVIRINVMTRMLQMSWILMILILMMMKWMYDDVWLCMMMYVLRHTTTINQSVDLYFQQAGHARNPKFQLRDSRFSNTVFGRSTGICPDSTVDTFHFEKTIWGLCSFQNTFGITLTPGATMCYIDMIEVAIPTPQHWHLWYITGWWLQSP